MIFIILIVKKHSTVRQILSLAGITWVVTAYGNSGVDGYLGRAWTQLSIGDGPSKKKGKAKTPFCLEEKLKKNLTVERWRWWQPQKRKLHSSITRLVHFETPNDKEKKWRDASITRSLIHAIDINKNISATPDSPCHQKIILTASSTLSIHCYSVLFRSRRRRFLCFLFRSFLGVSFSPLF